WPSSSNSPTLSASARSRMLMPCRSPMRRRRALSSPLLKRSLPARAGSSELEVEPDVGSTARAPDRAEPRRGLELDAAFSLDFLPSRFAGLDFLAAFLFLAFLAALRFLAMAMDLSAAGTIHPCYEKAS